MRIGTVAAWKAWFGGKRLAGWICLFLMLFVCLVVLPIFRTEDAVKCASLAFQLFGIALVVIGVSNTLRERGRPGVLQALKGYFSQTPFRTTDSHAEIDGVGVGAATGTVRASVTQHPSDESLDALRSRFIDYMKETNTALSEANKRIDVLERSLARRIQQLQIARANDMASIQRELTEGLVGGYTLSVVGSVYLAVGVFLGTFPAEIACRLPAWWS